MAYQALANKYRPGVLSDVAGQDHVTRTLANSISKGRIANAYLFCGPRGIGKTSIARIFSKMLNCGDTGPGGDPCGNCDVCREISAGVSMDVIEIDGASNRGIEDVRALRENVRFSPSGGKYKIFIIDEVHMLTSEAFNALLKTLEEPPAHVKFIFATTEPHKVIPTIMSRCQRFDLRKIPHKVIYGRITDIASSEGIEIEEDAVTIISRAADGSLRDALVILDQMVSFSSGKILSTDVSELLGMIKSDKIHGLVKAIIEKDPGISVRIVDELISSGKDPSFINTSLIAYFRDLMILKSTGAPSSDMAMSAEETKEKTALKDTVSLEEILYILQNFTHCSSLIKGALFSRAPFEITVVRMAKRETAMSLSDIMQRLEIYEKKSTKTNDISFSAGDIVKKAGETEVRGSGLSPDKEDPGNKGKRPVPNSVGAPRSYSDEEDLAASEDGFAGQNKKWKTLLSYVKSRNMSVYIFLSSARLMEFSRNSLIVEFAAKDSFNKEALETGANTKVLKEAVCKVMGQDVDIRMKLSDDSVNEDDGSEIIRKKSEAREEMKPVIEKAINVFGGRIVRDIIEGD